MIQVEELEPDILNTKEWISSPAQNIVIPSDIVQATGMTEAEFILEIAILLYKMDKISGGKAREWTGLNVMEFQTELAKRGVDINYDVEDLHADVNTLKSLGLL